mmetsp:Transcript_21908/g.64631  ORF Transcript_21908/g.64631 Transcript_21908/m.64631 type:complete len:252 (-) Transcript_21908:181-936(-)
MDQEIEASGASFVAIPPVHGVHGTLADPVKPDGCTPHAGDELRGAIALVRRGNCTFYDKVLHAQTAGAVGVVVVDTEAGPIGSFTMSGPEPEDSGVTIPVGIISRQEGVPILNRVRRGEAVVVSLRGFEREVLTARPHRGITLENLPGYASERQSLISWFPGYNYRLSKCRVCNAQIGYFLNHTPPDVRSGEDGADYALFRAAEAAFNGAQADELGKHHLPVMVHAILREDVADAQSLLRTTQAVHATIDP